MLPGVHRVVSLVKRWLLGTLHGAVEGDHIQAYLDEFAFRSGRHKSPTRGMLFFRLMEQAVATGPTTYDALVANPRPRPKTPTPPAVRRQQPASLAPGVLDRPWRARVEDAS